MPRRHHGHELWQDLLAQVSDDDGLPTFTSKGMWTAKKLYFVCQYLEQFTRGMKSRRGFPSGLCYVDLFCGSGVSVVDLGDGRPRRYPGSPLIAANTPEPFDRLIFADIDQERINALRERLQPSSRTSTRLMCVDSNMAVNEIIQHVPVDALSVAFIDPYSLNVWFETVQTIAKQRALDLIILFSDRFDLGRNVHRYYYPDEEVTKLDRFLGTMEWRSQLDTLGDQSGSRVRELFADIYRSRLAEIGYKHSQSWPLEGPQGPVFRVVYASKHPLGLKFCDIALHRDFEGNRGLFGPGA